MSEHYNWQQGAQKVERGFVGEVDSFYVQFSSQAVSFRSYSHVRPCSCPFNERKYQSGGGRRVTVVSNKNVPISSSLNRTTESKCLCRCHCKPSRVEFLKGEADKCEGPVDEGGGKRPLVDKAVSTSSLPVKKQTKSSHTKGLRLSPIRQSRSTRK